MTSTPRVTIIGGGLSGAAVAFHLLNSARPLDVSVIEPSPRIGPGLAFGACESYHLLNVPAGRMSLLPSDPNHFLRWLEGHRSAPLGHLVPPNLSPSSFVSRRLFGDYVAASLDGAITAASAVRFHHHRSTAIGLALKDHVYRITLADGSGVESDFVVLALGNIAPTTVHPACHEIRHHPRYTHDIWSVPPWRNISPTERILFLGTGLTMIDGALALARSGHSGEVIGLSRRGLLPAVHDVRGPAFPPIELRIEKLKLRSLISTVRGAIHTAQKEGIPWQAVLDSLRSRTPEIWSHLSLTDQRRFLRHIKSYWETNRHRLAPELYREIESLRCSGRLRIIAGNLARVRSVGERFAIELRSRGSSSLEQLEVDRIINCTGPEGKLDRDTSPLFRTLFDAQLLARDSLGFGLRASPQGFVINDRGEVSSSLLTLGSLLKGSLWETTAVPEIRVQAAAIGEAIRGRLGSP